MKTGWPPSLLMQDDDSRLSRWFASRPDARYTFRKNIMENKMTKYYPLRNLTLEEVAFVDAYCHAVAVAPRAEVVRFVAVDPEYRCSREFYDSMSDIYTSIADAREVWYQAMQFAKEFK